MMWPPERLDVSSVGPGPLIKVNADGEGPMRELATGGQPVSHATGVRRHAVVSLGIALTRNGDGDSPRAELDVLEKAPHHARAVANVLTGFQYQPFPSAVSVDAVRFEEVVEAAVVAEDVDVLIVHIVGHGELAEGSSEKLYILDSDGERLPRPVDAWIDLIEDHPTRHRPMTLFILDVCYAGKAAVTAWHTRMNVDQRRAWDIVSSLARQLRDIDGHGGGTDQDEASGQTAGNPADYLLSLLPEDGRPVTVVIDALDEALRPEDITTALLLPLARQAQGPCTRLRLLVGTRDDQRFERLLALAQDADGCTDLSAIEPDSVCRDVTTYVSRLLAADGPYAAGTLRPVRNSLAKGVADMLTGPRHNSGPAQNTGVLQWGEFLTAGLYAHYLLTSPLPGTTEEATALGRAVPRSLPALLKLDLQRHQADQPLLRPVLTALAFAQGRGMPEDVLAHAALAFTAPSDTTRLPLPDLYTLLDSEARFYLRRDVDDDGTTLYRLFHEGLADWLRDPGSQPPAQDTPTATVSPLQKPAERLYERLLDSLPRDASGSRQWHLATAYLLRHIAQHAISAGRLDELLTDGGYLQHADPHTLADALHYAHSEQARLNAAVYRASWSVHHALPPTARRQLLALDAARFRNTRLQAELPGDTDWRVRWATGSQVSTALARTLTGHTSVDAVAVAELDGRPHVITGGHDGVVGVRDLTTGAQTHTLTGHTGTVLSVAVAELDGRPHVITGGHDGVVRVWDLTTGTLTRTLTGHTGPVDAVAVAELGGRPHAITGGRDRTVRVWDLATGTCLTMFHCPAPVTALAVTPAATAVVAFSHEVAILDLAPLKGRLR
jgi:hypothetical protein